MGEISPSTCIWFYSFYLAVSSRLVSHCCCFFLVSQFDQVAINFTVPLVNLEGLLNFSINGYLPSHWSQRLTQIPLLLFENKMPITPRIYYLSENKCSVCTFPRWTLRNTFIACSAPTLRLLDKALRMLLPPPPPHKTWKRLCLLRESSI